MANSIELAVKFQPILDEIYKLASLTAMLDSQTKAVDGSGANEVKIFKTSMVGLGTYSRATGYVAGDVTGTWETIKLLVERGRAFSIDRLDNEESLGMAFGTLVGEFMRTMVVPEVDAYRFSKFASATSISTVTPATLDTAAKVLAAVDVASLQMDEDQVPSVGRKLFISSTCYRLLNAAISRTLANEGTADRRLKMLDELEIIPVPQARFYTAITLDAGASASAGGFSKGAGKDINFLMVHPSAVWQAKKHDALKIFSPEVNQTSDGWLIQYRLYHDAGVYDNKVDGIYLHNKA
jgi:hypothetical protein